MNGITNNDAAPRTAPEAPSATATVEGLGPGSSSSSLSFKWKSIGFRIRRLWVRTRPVVGPAVDYDKDKFRKTVAITAAVSGRSAEEAERALKAVPNRWQEVYIPWWGWPLEKVNNLVFGCFRKRCLVRRFVSWVWLMVPYRYEWRLFVWLSERVPIRTVKPGQWKNLNVKVDLDMGPDEQQMHVINLPVDLWEYPDVLRARAISVRLEMVGREGISPARVVRWMHAGPGMIYDCIPCSDGHPAFRRSRNHPDSDKHQTKPTPSSSHE